MPETVTEFDRCETITLRFEGGKVDNPRDPGGRTAFGVTQREYTKFVGQPRDVWLITAPEVRTIYFTEYWQASGAGRFQWPLDFLVFDTAVNCGNGRAKEFLEHTRDPAMFLAWRLHFYRWLAAKKPATAGTFLKGWERRVDQIRVIALPSIPDLKGLPVPL